MVTKLHDFIDPIRSKHRAATIQIVHARLEDVHAPFDFSFVEDMGDPMGPKGYNLGKMTMSH